MIAGAVGTQVLGRRQAFLDAAVEPAESAHLVGGFRHGAMARANDHHHRRPDIHGHPEAETPVDHRQHDDDAADEHRRAERLGHHATEEVRDGGDVTVDTLDQLARRVGAMELVVEAEDVTGHRESEFVGRPPGRDRREPDDDDGEHLGHDRDGEIEQRELCDLGARGAVGRLVDDPPDDERTGDEQAGTDGDEHAEADPPPCVGPEQRAERAPTSAARRGPGCHRDIVPHRSLRRAPDFPGAALLPTPPREYLRSQAGSERPWQSNVSTTPCCTSVTSNGRRSSTATSSGSGS